MQLNSIYLYSNKLDVFTNRVDSWTRERFRKVYNRNLKIFKGSDNRIDLQIRNGDEKPLNFTGSTLVFNLISRETQTSVLNKDCQAVDLSQGKMIVTITEDELYGIEKGLYDYTLTKELRTIIDAENYTVTERRALYMDSQFDAFGTIEVLGDVKGTVTQSLLIDDFERVINRDIPQASSAQAPFNLPRPNYSRHTPTSGYEEEYYSSIIDAKSQLVTASSLHTFQFYFSSYQGTVTIQGSIEDQGATPSIWADLVELSSNDNQFVNIVGKYNWFRIKHIPDVENTGTVDKILYR